MSTQPIHIYSEIEPLKTVCLHRPGKELENLIPDNIERLLFDDIPYLEEAQKEHDNFAQVLRDNGVEVVYLEDLVAESLDAANQREVFVDEWLSETSIDSSQMIEKVKQHLSELETKDLVLKTMEGFKKSEIQLDFSDSLTHVIEDDYPLLIDPMPSLYFTRDPFATIGNGVSLNRMYATTRNRETIYGKYIFKYHPIYGNEQVDLFYNRDEDTPIEGGDILVLSEELIAIGISQRTSSRSIEKIAMRILETTSFNEVLAFLIEDNRKFMHLDTVFTMIDHDIFTIHPEIKEGLRVVSIKRDANGDLNLNEHDAAQLDQILAEALELDSVTLIPCGGGDIVTAAREQWNDGSNTLAIAPGVVVVYERNTVTNQLMEEHGVKLLKIKGSELVRGRGGPRCMSMPLVRKAN